ncbi:MAG: RidA family protein [Anaerolineales bacterium]|nr:RidA family protein [Anaerolineales bacterium]
MTRINYSTGAPWEPIVGYSRVVQVDNAVYVAGTTGIGPDGQVVAPDDAYAQTIQALRNLERALNLANANLKDVVRTRLYVTDIRQWEAIGRAHGEFFGQYRPVTTMVQVAALIDPAMLIEVEADALLGQGSWRWVEG